ncbi:26235_t:CDS:1, partial [Dentiscutata erythropus]
MYGDKCEFLTTIDNIYTGTFGISVALKCLHDSSNVGEDFLNE